EPTTVDDVQFNRGPARRPQPVVSDPLIQWSTGLPIAKTRNLYAGWLVEVGRDEGVDDCLGHSFETGQIKHGGGDGGRPWAVPTGKLFGMAEGVQSIGEMKHTEERYGIAFGWRTLDGGRQQSKLVARVLLREVLEAGLVQPFTLSLKSTLTGDLLTALQR